jgi:hypothetical protein
MKTETKAKFTPGPWSYGMSADSQPHFYFHVGPERRMQWHLQTYGDRPVTEADAGACGVDLYVKATNLCLATEELLRVLRENSEGGEK